MEWYWSLALIAGFVGVVALLVYLGKSGKMNRQVFQIVASVVQSIGGVADVLEKSSPNKVTTTLDKAFELLNSAVFAAENLYYNEIIEADERESKCMEIFAEFLASYQIQLPDDIQPVIEYAIKATCERMGHGRVIEEEFERVAEEES